MREILAALLLIAVAQGQAHSRKPPRGMGERLREASGRFLGVPYVLGPLGEGPEGEFDRSPMFSDKGLDCTTFVEESMAFALAGESGAMDFLRRIRYRGGAARYEMRNHFPEVDWLPNNAAAGFLRDITSSIAGGRTLAESKTISKREWYLAKTEADLKGFEDEAPEIRLERLKRFRALGEGVPDQGARVKYVPIELLEELLDSIPSGTVASLVREARPDRPTIVTHQFFIFDGPDGKVVRHAAKGKCVMDVPALGYLKGFGNSSWRVLGLNLAAVRAP
jgi:hypothetical protein